MGNLDDLRKHPDTIRLACQDSDGKEVLGMTFAPWGGDVFAVLDVTRPPKDKCSLVVASALRRFALRLFWLAEEGYDRG